MKCPVGVGTEGAEGEGMSQLVQSVSSSSTVDATESWCPNKTVLCDSSIKERGAWCLLVYWTSILSFPFIYFK